jgi:hypothetical protein
MVSVGTPTPTDHQIVYLDDFPSSSIAHEMLSATHSDSNVGLCTRGDIIAATASSPAYWERVAGNTAATRLYLRSTGTGALATVPVWTALDHGADLAGLTDDDHTQYALLAGRGASQTLSGGASSGSLTLRAWVNAACASVDLVEAVGTLLSSGTIAAWSAGWFRCYSPLQLYDAGFPTSTRQLVGSNLLIRAQTLAGAEGRYLSAASLEAIPLGTAGAVSGQLPIAYGGTGAATFADHAVLVGPTSGGPLAPTVRALEASDIPDISATYQPLAATLTAIAGVSVAVGSLLTGQAGPTWAGLAGDTSNARRFLRSLSVAGVATPPAWDALEAADIPDISATYATAGHNHAATYQPLDDELTLLAALALPTNALKVVRVNAAEDAFELAAVAGGSGDLLADGTVPLTANWDVGAFKITAAQLESDVAAGTAPLVVASDTVVANLNASKLEGNAASAFQAASARLGEIAALAVTDGNFLVGDGAAWVAESGATARTSLGLGTAAVAATGDFEASGAVAAHAGASGAHAAAVVAFAASDKLLGRATAGAGNGEEIACTAAGRALLDDATAADQLTTLGAAAASHAHAATDITSGTLAVARGGTGDTSLTAAPTNYTPGAETVKGHLDGIDTALGSVGGGGGGYTVSWAADTATAGAILTIGARVRVFSGSIYSTAEGMGALYDRLSSYFCPAAGTVSAMGWCSFSGNNTTVIKVWKNGVLASTDTWTAVSGAKALATPFAVALGDKLYLEYDAGTAPNQHHVTLYVAM